MTARALTGEVGAVRSTRALIWVEGPDAAIVAELADSLAAVAGERLH